MAMKSLELLLLVIGVCLSVVRADVDCSKRPKFVDPRTCCPLPEFVTTELKDKCQIYNKTEPPPTPMSGEQSSEGKRRHHHPRYHHPPPCFVSCVFNGTGFYEDYKVDQERLNKYLQVVFKDDTELQTLANDAFSSCVTKFDEFRSSNRTMPGPPRPTLCPLHPSFLMGCVYKRMIKNCPAAIWTDTQECNDMREHFDNCKPPHRRPASVED